MQSIIKKNKRRVALTNYIFNSINLVISIFNGLIFVPIYIKKLNDINDYGVWLACMGIITSLGVLELNLSGISTQKYSLALSNNNENRFKALIASNLLLLSIIILLWIVLGLILIKYFPNYITSSGPRYNITLTLILTFLGFVCTQICFSIGAFFQSIQITFFQNCILTLSLIINSTTVLACLYLFNLGIVSFAMGSLISGVFSVLSLGFYSIYIWKKYSFGMISFNKLFIIELLKDSFGLTIEKISLTLKGNLQAPLVAVFINPSSAAILNVSSKLIFVLGSIVSNISTSVYAGLVHNNNSNEKNTIKLEIGLIVDQLSKIFLSYSIFISKGFIIWWIEPELYGGIYLILIFSISQFFIVKRNYYQTLVMATGKFNLLSYWLLIELIVNMILMVLFFYFLPKNLKIYAIPISTLISTFILNNMLRLIENRQSNYQDSISYKEFFNNFYFIFIPLIAMNYCSFENKFDVVLNTLLYIPFIFIVSLVLNNKWYKLVLIYIKKGLFKKRKDELI